jgi:two-component system OmpR family sensor kinase
VLIGVLVITLGTLAVFDVAAVTALRTYLVKQTDGTLQSALANTRSQLPELLPAFRKPDQAVNVPLFGSYYIAFVPSRGAVVNLQAGPGVDVPARSAVAAANVATVKAGQVKGGGDGQAGQAISVVGPGPAQVRLRSVKVPGLSGTLVAGTNLRDVDATVAQLRLIVVTGSAAAAVLIFLGVGLIMRQGLRPIETMARQADRITAGDLTDRVDEASSGSEVSRLGAALNGMLGRIQASVAEREASQELMRRFLAEASHELRSPLASLRANAELYQQGALTSRGQVDEAMRRIMLEARRMGRLVDDMLRLARLDQHPARQRDPVDVGTLVGDCVERSRIADPDRTWQVRVEPGLTAVGDAEMLGRAVDNLLANVHTHTPPGTTAVITAYRESGRVVVRIADNGPGVPADRLPRIFDRFYRAGSPSQCPGSGLGLAIVSEIAAAHGGTVRAAPGWPSGLCVILAVPEWRSAAAAPSRSGAEPAILTTTEPPPHSLEVPSTPLAPHTLPAPPVGANSRRRPRGNSIDGTSMSSKQQRWSIDAVEPRRTARCGTFWRRYVATTTMVVRPILTLSPFFRRWALNMRRPLSQVPLVEPRSSTYQ